MTTSTPINSMLDTDALELRARLNELDPAEQQFLDLAVHLYLHDASFHAFVFTILKTQERLWEKWTLEEKTERIKVLCHTVLYAEWFVAAAEDGG